MKQPRRSTALCAVAVLFTLGLPGCRRETPAANQTPREQPAALMTGKPERKTLTLSTTQPGRIEAFEETPLYAKVEGYVDDVQADIGDRVEKDQVLVTLSVPELADDVDQKQAMLAQAEAEVAQAGSAVEAAVAAAQTAESRISETQAGIARTQAEQERWKSEYARIQQLADQGSVTKKLEEETLNQLRAAEAAGVEAVAKVESSRAAYHEAQANVAKARADRGAAEARLQVAKADLARAQTMLGYTRIKAPFDGVITRREVDTGHFVQPASAASGVPLMAVARTDRVRIFVEVPEMEAPYVDAGDRARVAVQALPTHRFDAAVARSSWALLQVNHALRAEVDVPNAQSLLRPGMYASVTLTLAEQPDVLVLPAAAILRDGDAAYCMRVVFGKIEKRPVELGLRSGSEVEIVSGLDESTEVVLKDPGRLHADPSPVVTPPDR